MLICRLAHSHCRSIYSAVEAQGKANGLICPLTSYNCTAAPCPASLLQLWNMPFVVGVQQTNSWQQGSSRSPTWASLHLHQPSHRALQSAYQTPQAACQSFQMRRGPQAFFWLMQPRSLGIGGSTQLTSLRLFGSSQLPLCRWLALHQAKSSFRSIQQPLTHRSVCAEIIALCMSKASLPPERPSRHARMAYQKSLCFSGQNGTWLPALLGPHLPAQIAGDVSQCGLPLTYFAKATVTCSSGAAGVKEVAADSAFVYICCGKGGGQPSHSIAWHSCHWAAVLSLGNITHLALTVARLHNGTASVVSSLRRPS